MRRATGLVTFLLLACATTRIPPGVREIDGYSLRGSGCHVELLAPDGAVICSAIATAVPKCFPFFAAWNDADGGFHGAQYSLGSSCPQPRLSSVEVDKGIYYVESSGVMFNVVCDELDECRKSWHYEFIQRCCQQDASIRDTATCSVRKDLLCSPEDAGATGPDDEKDGRR